MLDAASQEFVDLIVAAGNPSLPAGTLQMARERLAGLVNLLGPGPELGDVRDEILPGPGGPMAVRVYTPVREPAGSVVYYRGGGWTLGSLEGSDAFARTLALQAQSVVVAVDYRNAPEHVFPAAVEDAMAGLEWAASRFGGPLIVCGDSAGGNLALVCALKARDRGAPKLAFQVLLYPVTDHLFDRPSYVQHANSVPVGAAEMRWFWDQYAPEPQHRDHVDASPLRAKAFARLPPVYLVLTEYDPLRDEGFELADRMTSAGVEVTLRYYDDQFHGFASMVNYLAAADLAVADIGRAIRDACQGPDAGARIPRGAGHANEHDAR